MKRILLFGAGKSATVLIDYLKEIATEYIWQVIVADNDLGLAQQKVGEHKLVKAIQITIENEIARKALVHEADVVISMLPPSLHYLIALDCIEFKKHLLTASYIDDKIKQLQPKIEASNILFLYEMGLDPGIDHMSAMELINKIKAKGGVITSFKSHCGGLIAPESDNNPWHYKISWNPRNIVLAGKAGAIYKENGKIVNVSYQHLFNNKNIIQTDSGEVYTYYANRDSLGYMTLYNLEGCNTFMRTTLRHPEFCFGWKNIIDLKLTDEEKIYDTNAMSIAIFFKQHFEKHGFGEWLNQLLVSRLSYANEMMDKLMQLIEINDTENAEQNNDEVMLVNETGELDTITIEALRDKAEETILQKMHEANLSIQQLFFLGLKDETLINKGLCSAADVLQFIIEKKLALEPDDKDLIVMRHEIEYLFEGKKYTVNSDLSIIGEDSTHTAMAKTVGLPLGIAAKLLLEGKMATRGLHVPVSSEIYEPVLKELKEHAIEFKEKIMHD